jgi:hypothetical protein
MEGVGSVVIQLSTGAMTLSEDDGAYAFYDLPAGQYAVAVDTARLSQTLEIQSPASVDVTLLDTGTSSVDFRLGAKQKPIILQPARR